MISPTDAIRLSEYDVYAVRFWESELDKRLCANQNLKTVLPLDEEVIEYLADKYREAGWSVTTNKRTLEFSNAETNSNE